MSEAGSSGAIPAAGGKKEFTSSAKLKRAELRQHPRFRVEDAKTELYLQGFLAKLGIGRKNEARVAVNLSEGGLLLSTHGKLAAGTKVQLRIEMEKFKEQYKNSLFNVAMTFIEPFPVGLVITLLCAGYLCRRRESRTVTGAVRQA